MVGSFNCSTKAYVFSVLSFWVASERLEKTTVRLDRLGDVFRKPETIWFVHYICLAEAYVFSVLSCWVASGRLEKTAVLHELGWWCIPWNYLVDSFICLAKTYVFSVLSCWVASGKLEKTTEIHDSALWCISDPETIWLVYYICLAKAFV
jgi:hypothetical protein